MKRILRPLLVAFGLLLVSACGSDDPVTTSDMWARPTAPDAPNAAFYGTVTNNTDGDITLVAGYAKECDRIELHRSSMQDGVMSMDLAELADTKIAPGGSLLLEPMGLHVMCLGVSEPLVEGSPISLELTFEDTAVIFTEVAVEQR